MLQYLHPDYPLEVVLLSGLASACALVIGRRSMNAPADKSNDWRNVCIVGSGTLARKTAEAIRRDSSSRRLVRQLLPNAQFAEICMAGQFSTFAREEFIDEIIIASREVDLAYAINEGRRQRVDVTVVAEVLRLLGAKHVAIEDAGGSKLIGVHQERIPLLELSSKRLIDTLLSAVGLVAIFPLLCIIGALVRLDSPGPVLYRSPRIGHKGRRFICYKFRTMVANAESAKESLRGRNERNGAFFKITDDPRVTGVGKLLRRYSLDELPQLWNVLRGEMSLVGPRPHPPDDAKHYLAPHLQRLDFVPGITGLWQVTARQDPPFERSVALDVEYIKSWSLWLDFQILCRTVGVVLRGSGA